VRFVPNVYVGPSMRIFLNYMFMLETNVRDGGVGTERSFVQLSLGIIYVSFFSARHCCRQTVSAKSRVSCYYFPPLLLVCAHTRNYFTPPPKKKKKNNVRK